MRSEAPCQMLTIRIDRVLIRFYIWMQQEELVMDYSNAIEPVTVLKTRSAELIRRARESRQPVVITQNGKATAVLQDIESFQKQRETLLLLRYLSQGEHDIRQGRLLSDHEADQHFRAKLDSLREAKSSKRDS
jgi:prevent-host-death family protein